MMGEFEDDLVDRFDEMDLLRRMARDRTEQKRQLREALSGRRLNAFCQSCGDRPCPDCYPGETFNLTYKAYSDLLRRMARRCSTYRRQSQSLALREAYWRDEAVQARDNHAYAQELQTALARAEGELAISQHNLKLMNIWKDEAERVTKQADQRKDDALTAEKRLREYVQSTARLNVDVFERADKRTAEITRLRMALQEAADSLADASRFVPADRECHFRRQEVRARGALRGTDG